jgi:hypothetical protein
MVEVLLACTYIVHDELDRHIKVLLFGGSNVLILILHPVNLRV